MPGAFTHGAWRVGVFRVHEPATNHHARLFTKTLDDCGAGSCVLLRRGAAWPGGVAGQLGRWTAKLADSRSDPAAGHSGNDARRAPFGRGHRSAARMAPP